MSENLRKYPRNPSDGYLRVRTSISGVAYTVSLRDVSLSGAYVRTVHLPVEGEQISFEILDEYGLRIASGQGTVVRVVSVAHELGLGFAVQFEKDLDMAMLDFLSAIEEEAESALL
ncbi:MAG: hypothetical protein DSY80_03435 [Desulfocapsa sp.]|nr:MAG: hypothetical protein DSY80_03435 [Desulfocapsa sp.]